MTHASSKLESSQAGHTTDATNPGAAIDYRLFLDCVHCGICTAVCPTFLETGDENDSPRGRIYLMRGVTDGRLAMSPPVERHLELCLDCRACETACPSGVQYGQLIEPFRVALAEGGTDRKSADWFSRWILFGLFPYPKRLRRALLAARVAQWARLDRLAMSLSLFRLLPPRMRQLAEMLPPLGKRLSELPAEIPAVGRRRARVALFTGCVGDVVFRSTNWATARVLAQNGCDVVVPKGQVCCGAIHFHSGQSEPAREFADENLRAFGRLSEFDAIVSNVAGCGAMLKGYGHDWHDGQENLREQFAAKVRDVSEFLDQLGLVPPLGEIPLVATYHDACHLAHAQRVTAAPRRLLAQIPGLKLVDLHESEVCCGAAGTYNLTEPEMAGRLSQRKLDNILATGADAVITGNAGCQLQIAREARQRGHRLWVAHPIDVLDLSYRREQPQF